MYERLLKSTTVDWYPAFALKSASVDRHPAFALQRAAIDRDPTFALKGAAIDWDPSLALVGGSDNIVHSHCVLMVRVVKPGYLWISAKVCTRRKEAASIPKERDIV